MIIKTTMFLLQKVSLLTNMQWNCTVNTEKNCTAHVLFNLKKTKPPKSNLRWFSFTQNCIPNALPTGEAFFFCRHSSEAEQGAFNAQVGISKFPAGTTSALWHFRRKLKDRKHRTEPGWGSIAQLQHRHFAVILHPDVVAIFLKSESISAKPHLISTQNSYANGLRRVMRYCPQMRKEERCRRMLRMGDFLPPRRTCHKNSASASTVRAGVNFLLWIIRTMYIKSSQKSTDMWYTVIK